jgi:hypothetical protein
METLAGLVHTAISPISQDLGYLYLVNREGKNVECVFILLTFNFPHTPIYLYLI